jgi:hypothetical protein
VSNDATTTTNTQSPTEAIDPDKPTKFKATDNRTPGQIADMHAREHQLVTFTVVRSSRH